MQETVARLKADFEKSLFYGVSALAFAAGSVILAINLLINQEPFFVGVGSVIAIVALGNAAFFGLTGRTRAANTVLIVVLWSAVFFSLPHFDIRQNPLTWPHVVAVLTVLLLPVKTNGRIAAVYMIAYVAVVVATHVIPGNTTGIRLPVFVMSTASMLILVLAVHRYTVLGARYERLLGVRLDELLAANAETERFKTAMEHAVEPTAMLGTDGTVHHVNLAWRKRYGVPSGDDVRTSVAVALGSDKFDTVWKELEEGVPVNFTTQLPSVDGSVATEVALSPVIKDGKMLAVICRRRPWKD